MGKMNFVDGLDPKDFRVSKYCRLMVLASTVLATWKTRSRASLNP